MPNGPVPAAAPGLPAEPDSRPVFRLSIKNDTMMPRYQAGEQVVACVDNAPHPSDYIALEINGGWHVCLLLGREKGRLMVRRFNPRHDGAIAVSDVTGMLRILNTADLFTDRESEGSAS